MKRFVLTGPAVRDLEEIRAYLATQASPAIAKRVMQEVRRGIAFLGAQPGAGHVRDDLTELPVRFWPVYSFLIVYDPAVKPVQILRVLHGMRDVERTLRTL